MIDVHCHILPGVDDGAKTLADSVAMARMAAAAGTTTIVATPHMLHPQFHVPGPVALAKLEEVRAALKAAEIPVDVQPGGEIHWSADIEKGLLSGELLPLCASRRWILFELPYDFVPPAFSEVVFKLQMSGTFPVLAHPERIVELQENPDRIEAIRDAGIPVQITAMCLSGEFGRKPRKTAERWLEAGLVDIVASDGHSTLRRPPTLDEAARVVTKLAGATAAQWVLHEVPRRILAGEDVL